MKLIKAWVKLYRNIVDSGELTIENSVTCLVGKNESGKTALLKALYYLNPHKLNLVEMDTTKNFPRWLKRKYEREGNLEDIYPIQALFCLEKEDITFLNEKLEVSIPKNSKLYIKRSYGDKIEVKIESSDMEWINSLWDSDIIEDDLKSDINDIKTINELFDKLNELKQKKEKTVADAIEESTSTENEAELSEKSESEEDEDDYLVNIETILEIVEKMQIMNQYSSDESFVKEIMNILPKFFYYGSYSSLKGQINLDEIFEKINQEKENMNLEDETAIGLLKLAGITPEKIKSPDFEELIAELEASAIDITRQILEYWTQNDKLQVSFQIKPEISNSHHGNPIEYKCLNIRLNDLRHHMSTNFSTRSSGFQWFFSFIISFSDFDDRDDVIILLDEPGLGLHALAQNDLLNFIEDKLGNGRQVIYTNHSPFLVNSKKIENVRLVEDLTSDKDPDRGSKISENVLSVKDDTRFPLQAALGYNMAQNLFIGGYTLIVEGPSDLLYLKKLSEFLKQKEMTSLDSEITIAPVGGADKIPTFIAILGAHVDVTVLVDANMGNDSRLESMVNQNILEESRLIDISKITGDPSSNIEDLFNDEEYLKFFNDAFNKNIEVSTVEGDGSIIKRLENKIGDEFNHYSPAWALQKNSDYLDDLSEDTLKNFEKLFKTLNKTFK